MHRRMMMQSIGGVNPFQDATVAYSLRDLGLGTTHVVRVRRDSDDTEQDFTATEITDGTLTSFCGAGNGFVSIWYDQLGVYDASQATATLQPRIVVGGVLELENGKPALNPVPDKRLDTGFTGLSTKTLFITANAFQGSSNPARIFTSYFGSGGVGDEILFDNLDTEVRFYDGNDSVLYSYSSYADTNHLHYALRNANSLNVSLDGDVAVSKTITSTNPNTLTYKIAEEGGSNITETPISVQEVIVFATDKSAERPNIETNINNFYNIY